jgi:hypothetical protein
LGVQEAGEAEEVGEVAGEQSLLVVHEAEHHRAS